MYASGLLHKKKSSKSSKRGSGCCPVIRVKCKRKHGSAGPGASLSLKERLALYKKAKPGKVKAEKAYKRAQAAFQKATGLSGTGPIHPQHENTSLPAREVAKAVNNPVMSCSVHMGNKHFKGMTGAQAQAKVVELSRGLVAKRCMAVVKRGA